MSIMHSKLSIKAKSLSCGLVGGISLSLLALFAMMGYGQELVQVLSGLFIGYEANGAGILLGATWGFLVGCVFGSIQAWFYNSIT